MHSFTLSAASLRGVRASRRSAEFAIYTSLHIEDKKRGLAGRHQSLLVVGVPIVSAKAKPLSMSPPCKAQSTVSQSTNCCSLRGDKFSGGDETGAFKGTRGRKRPPHIQLLWSCCIEKRILFVGGAIVARPVDLYFHGKLQCSVGWPFQQTNNFNTKVHLVRTRRNNVIPEVSNRDRLASR